MKRPFKSFLWSAFFGTALVIPFILLEWFNTGFRNSFPLTLFAFFWVLGTLFAAFFVRSVGLFGRSALPKDRFVLAVVGMLFVLSVWVTAVLDQIPCFMGVPNCD